MNKVISLYDSTLLSGSFYPKINAYYFKQWKDKSSILHSHEHIEIMYVTYGNCTIISDNNIINLKSGEFILIDAHVTHQLIVNNTSCRIMNIEFSFINKDIDYPSIKELANSSPSLEYLITQNSKYVVLKDCDEIYGALKSLIINLDNTNSDTEILSQIFLSQILIKLGQLVKESNEQSNFMGIKYIKDSLKYIYTNYDKNILVKDIATSINLHPSYLERMFKQYTGKTIIQYITKVRLAKAKMLLSNTDISVTEISLYVGINSIQYFNHMFKKSTAMTPSQYRKNTSNHSRNQ